MTLVARRGAGALALLWLVLTLTFVLVRLAPGDPTTFLVAPTADPAQVARVRSQLGLDHSIVVQYGRWAGRLLRGDLGESFARRLPVRTVLASAIPVSLGLGAVSLALTFLIGVPLGMLQAMRRGTVDRAITIATTTVYAAPSYWLALALVAVFTYGAAAWGIPFAWRLPAFGLHTPGADLHGSAALVDLVRHSVLPVAILSAVGAAGIARYARSNVADVLGLDFVRTARAKGLGPARVYGRHVLAPVLPSLIVLLALSLPGVVAGSIFVEAIFAWPGMGHLMISAIQERDYPVVMGATAVYAALVIFANLAGDMSLPLLDPRRTG